MLLVEFTINGTLTRISQEGIKLTNFWDNKIVAFDAPQFKVDTDYGGYCRMGWGTIQLEPNLFDSDNWPPPITCAITTKYTATTEGAAETLFTGIAHLSDINREFIVYNIYDTNEDTDLLAETTNYDGDTVPLPRAFGVVAHVNPVRLPDVAGKQQYDLGHIQGTEHVNWHCFDDGVDVCGDVINVAANAFQLNAAPVGEVTISGTGEDTTLADVVDWACGASYLNYTFNGDNDRASSPNVSHWATDQQVLVDFLSKACADFTHLFYVKSSTLYLVDMLLDNGTRTITEFDYFPSTYNYLSPIANITSQWEYPEAGSWSQPGGGVAAAVYVKRTAKSATQSSSYAYGEERNLNIYSTTLADINTALGNIITVSHKARGTVRLPFIGSLPVPGENIIFNDTSLGQPSTLNIRARTIAYDFDSEEIRIEGEGSLTEFFKLLMESGDFLLLEGGDKILLELIA